MERKWKIYFSIVGTIALLMFLYQSNVFAMWTSDEPVSKGSRNVVNTDIYPSGEQADEQTVTEEFRVLNEENKERAEEAEAGIVPVNIKIPAIDVDAAVENVGVLENGEMGVPEDPSKAGWFEPGTQPGKTGNAVIAGHVDSHTGPAVFYDLEKLEPGDEITVTDDEEKERTYVVERMESYPWDESPIEEIFGPTSEKRLNVITCTGEFIRDKGGHQDRLVVYTTLKEEVEDETELPSPTAVEVSGSFVNWHAVRKDDVVGYRVYRSADGEDFQQVASISAHERKTYVDPEAGSHIYYVTAVDAEGNESAPSVKSNEN